MKTIYIYDLDNTLIDTQAKIKIKDGIAEEVNTNNPNFYDYSEFRKLSTLMREPTTYLFEEMKENYEYGYSIYIITARPMQHMVWKWLTKNKVCIDKRCVYCFRDDEEGYDVADFKADALSEIIEREFINGTQFHIYDDNVLNLKKMLMQNKYFERNLFFHLTQGRGKDFKVKEVTKNDLQLAKKNGKLQR